MKIHLQPGYFCAVVVLLVTLAAPPLYAQIDVSFNQSLSLDGSSEYVQVPANTNLTPTNITLEAWVNIPAGGLLTIASRGNGNNANTDYIFQIGDADAGTGTFVTLFGGSGWGVSTSSVPTSIWTHVAVTYDGTNKLFYINGAPAGIMNQPGALYSADSATAPLYLGRQGAACDCNFFNGKISEVRIWNYVRTASQIQADMNFTFFGPQPGLLAYYHLNEGGGTNVNDNSGNGNSGTLANGPAWAATAPPFLGTSWLWEGPAAGAGSVVLSDSNAWTATANASWLHLSAANQSGVASTNVIFTFDANPGLTRTGTLTIAGQTLAVTQAGSTYVAAPGPLTALASSGFTNPVYLAADNAGDVYFASENAVHEWSIATKTLIADGSYDDAPDVAIDGTGNVYVADPDVFIEGSLGAIVEWITASNTYTYLVTNNYDNKPFSAKSILGLTVDGAGNVWFPNGSLIDEWPRATEFMTFWYGNMNGTSVALDGADNVYFVNSNSIEKWSVLNHTAATLASPGLRGPKEVAVDGAGNVYVADLTNNAVYEWIAASNTVITPVSGLNGLCGVAVDGVGNIYVTAPSSNAVYEQPRAFVDPTAKAESAAAGNDILPAVLPATENLGNPFVPVSSNPGWLTITGATNGVVSFSFTQNTGIARTANISLLGENIPVTQFGTIGTATLLTGTHFLTNGRFQFSFTNYPGATFTVLSTTNVSLPLNRWTPLGAPAENPPGQYQFTDTAPTNSACFYILVSP
jgi:hypothetical protein